MPLSTKVVCCGAYVWLSLRSIVLVCWITCTKSITGSATLCLWRGAISGGQDWILLLLRGFSYVMFVLPWVSTFQGHHYLPFEMALKAMGLYAHWFL